MIIEKNMTHTRPKKHLPFHSLALLALLALLSSCHKNCVCQGYDGSSYTYSADEVDARGVTSTNLVFQAGQQFYAVCDWE